MSLFLLTVDSLETAKKIDPKFKLKEYWVGTWKVTGDFKATGQKVYIVSVKSTHETLIKSNYNEQYKYSYDNIIYPGVYRVTW